MLFMDHTVELFTNYNSTDMLPECLTSSKIGEGWGCNIFVPVLGGNGTKIAPTENIFDQPPGQML